jgi:hypothetical protein
MTGLRICPTDVVSDVTRSGGSRERPRRPVPPRQRCRPTVDLSCRDASFRVRRKASVVVGGRVAIRLGEAGPRSVRLPGVGAPRVREDTRQRLVKTHDRFAWEDRCSRALPRAPRRPTGAHAFAGVDLS